jgi:hypothetical protein
MIKFNPEDFNMEVISKEAKLHNLLTRNTYRAFGLRQDDNPPVVIKYNDEKRDVWSFEPPIRNFFRRNGMSIDFWYLEDDNFIGIGLRRDVRENPLLAAAIVQTIVYHVEGRLTLGENFRIAGLNQFECSMDRGI